MVEVIVVVGIRRGRRRFRHRIRVIERGGVCWRGRVVQGYLKPEGLILCGPVDVQGAKIRARGSFREVCILIQYVAAIVLDDGHRDLRFV